jgi:uncharacterized protein (UPF0276 family)
MRPSAFDPAAPFAVRVAALPRLGLGVSTEFGAGRTGLDVNRLRRERPDRIGFLELGVDLERGLDADADAWIARGDPTTFHFLDLNLEEPEDLDAVWLRDAPALARRAGAAWLCGDAGLWHMGPRERGHGVLQPPVLTARSADLMAGVVRRLRLLSGFEVLPENPPAHVYLGDLHLVDYFARLADRADCGLLLDVAHLAVYQRVAGRDPFDAFDRLPFERLVELHVAGGTPFSLEGRAFVDDDHGPEPLPETWALLEAILPRAANLRAVVFEAERNRPEALEAGFDRLTALVAASAAAPEVR